MSIMGFVGKSLLVGMGAAALVVEEGYKLSKKGVEKAKEGAANAPELVGTVVGKVEAHKDLLMEKVDDAKNGKSNWKSRLNAAREAAYDKTVA